MSRYRAAPDVLRAEINGQEVLLNTRTGVYHLVNRTGRSLLILLESGQEFDDAVAELATQESEDPARVVADAQVFLGALCERGLLQAIE